MSTGAAPERLPWWRLDQHPKAWVPLAAVALFILTVAGQGDAIACSASQPCGPDWSGAVLLGLLLSSAATVFVHRWTSAALAIAMTGVWLLTERSDPWWVLLSMLGYAALCLRIAVHAETGPVPPALTLPVPAPTGPRPRLGRGWRLGALALLLAGAGISWGTLAEQQRVQAQEEQAQVVNGRVTGQVDQTTITVRLADTDARVEVLDSEAYPVGSALSFYVDDQGLRQPVSEPYDITGILALAELALALAVAALLRARQYENGLRTFLRRPQPARLVRVINAGGIIAVFPFEPVSDLDPPYLIYPAAGIRPRGILSPATALTDGEARDDEEDDERAPVIATLYGVDRPGHWCAAEVEGVLLTPARPVTASPYRTTEPESLDTPVDPAELLPEDRTVTFEQRVHHRNTVLGILQTLGFGAATVLVFARFLTLGTVGMLVLAAVILAVCSEFCWRTLLRPRVAWHGAGLAVTTPFGGFNSRWEDVVQLAPGRSDVTIVVDGVGGAVLPTRRYAGRLPERTARQLALALRHARQHSLLGEPPPVSPPHRPASLYIACAALVPALVLLIHWAHSL